MGNLVASENENIRLKREYDLEGRLVRESQGAEFTIKYEYDLRGNLAKRETTRYLGETEKSQVVTYGYDALGQAGGLTVADYAPISFQRDSLGRIVKEDLTSELDRQYSYDPAGYLIEQSLGRKQGFAVGRQEYRYDQNGNLTLRKNGFEYEEFAYDPVGQILSYTSPENRVQKFLYDPAGNLMRTSKISPLLEKTADYLREGKYGDQIYRYDKAGNLVWRQEGKQVTKFKWDPAGRLVASEKNGLETIYRYDPFARRISKQTGNKLTRFYWDNDVLIGEAEFALSEAALAANETQNSYSITSYQCMQM